MCSVLSPGSHQEQAEQTPLREHMVYMSIKLVLILFYTMTPHDSSVTAAMV